MVLIFLFAWLIRFISWLIELTLLSSSLILSTQFIQPTSTFPFRLLTFPLIPMRSAPCPMPFSFHFRIPQSAFKCLLFHAFSFDATAFQIPKSNPPGFRFPSPSSVSFFPNSAFKTLSSVFYLLSSVLRHLPSDICPLSSALCHPSSVIRLLSSVIHPLP